MVFQGQEGAGQAGRHPAQRSLLARQKTTPDSIPCTLLLVPPSAGVQSGVRRREEKERGEQAQWGEGWRAHNPGSLQSV